MTISRIFGDENMLLCVSSKSGIREKSNGVRNIHERAG